MKRRLQKGVKFTNERNIEERRYNMAVLKRMFDGLKGYTLFNKDQTILLEEVIEEYKNNFNKHLFWSDEENILFQCLDVEDMEIRYKDGYYREFLLKIGVVDTFENFLLFSDVQVLREYYKGDASYKKIEKLIKYHHSV